MRRVWICAVALFGVLAIAAAAAAAPTDQISINVPVHVSQKTIYDVTINGFSRKRAIAYLFMDYTGCARTFAAEHKRAPKEANFYSVHGTLHGGVGLEVVLRRLRSRLRLPDRPHVGNAAGEGARVVRRALNRLRIRTRNGDLAYAEHQSWRSTTPTTRDPPTSI